MVKKEKIIKKPTQKKKAKIISKTKVKKVKDSSFAIIEYLNQQIVVYPDKKFILPLQKSIKKDEIIVFDKVLFTEQKIGNPYVENFVVKAKCLDPDIKDKKLIIFKYKAKKNYRIKTGHRQHWTLLITEKLLKKRAGEKK